MVSSEQNNVHTVKVVFSSSRVKIQTNFSALSAITLISVSLARSLGKLPQMIFVVIVVVILNSKKMKHFGLALSLK